MEREKGEVVPIVGRMGVGLGLFPGGWEQS